MRMVVSDYKGLVTIDGLNFHFAYNADMYQGGVAGLGLQLDPVLEDKKEHLEVLFTEISEAVNRYRDRINESTPNNTGR